MLLEALSTARDLGRLHDIASVLIRHGLGDAVRRLGLAHALKRAGKVVHWQGAQDLTKEPQVRLREALEELGPTFVKVGQILAGRADLLPPLWTDELSLLRERATTVPYEEIREQLTEDLGADPETVFQDFDSEPLAAASIAQVYRASLPDGTAVVLKVRRPGIRETVEADLRLLARLADKAEERMPELQRFRPRSLVRQFAHSLKSELDLRIETKNAARLRANLPDYSRIVIPKVHETWTRERLCVMDFLEGPSVNDWIGTGMTGHGDPQGLAVLGAETVLRTVFVDGFFHADPHPGNLILMPDGRLGLIDFGMVGYLSESRRAEFLGLLLAVVTRDVDSAVVILVGWADRGIDLDLDLLAQDCGAFIDRYYGLTLREVDTTELLGDLTALLRENHLHLPGDVALLLKVFISLESLGRQLDPGFEIATHIEPFAMEAAREANSPLATIRRGARDVGHLLASLPRNLKHLAFWARRGRIHIDVDLDRFGTKIDRSASRITVGLVTAALIVGTSIALTVPGGPEVLGLPLFGFLGFTSSIAGGIWLVWSILRSGRS